MATRPKTKASDASHRFDVATLRELAGEKVFARGIEYNEEGQVEIVSIDRSRALARVIGSEIYRCELRGTGNAISGSCSCPAFSDWGFCKHLVATALAANDLGPEAVKQAAGRLSKIRDHLRSKGIESLVDMIVDLAENNPDLLCRLELASALDTADDDSLFAQFKKAITETTRTHGYIEYGEAGDFAEKIRRLLDQIEDLIKGNRAKLALRLLEYFFARMDQVLDSMDDSDGEGGAVYTKACEVHLTACRNAQPAPFALARDLFKRETESPWNFFHGASETYADVLGSAGLAEYRRLASEAWQIIPPVRPGGRQAHDEQYGERYRLTSILESFAERDGDIDARIAIRAKNLSTAYAYLGIAQLCLDNGRETKAAKWAEEGLWQFEDQPDQRLVFFAADLYRRTGREKDADELLWRTFERLPSIDLYRKVKEIAGGKQAAVCAARDRAIATLQAKLDTPNAKARRSQPRELLLDVLMLENRLAEAWQIVRTHGCGGDQRLALAHASEQSHPMETLATYALEADRLAGLGGQHNYDQVSKMIERMQSIRQRLGQGPDHAAYLADFVGRHKAKRNLMKIMQARTTQAHARSAAAR